MPFTFGQGSIDDVIAVGRQIPEFTQPQPKGKIESRLSGKDFLILQAKSNNELAGYKIGYAISNTEFYSWIGGVIPKFRGLGLATELRQKQEAWALEKGYATLRVKSMNRFPAMLHLLIKSGYQICGYEDKGSVETGKICFVKDLRLNG